MAELLEQIRQLSVREQLALIREIADGLENQENRDANDQFSPEEKAELRSRMAAVRANPLDGDDWPSVRARLEAQAAAFNSQTNNAKQI